MARAAAACIIAQRGHERRDHRHATVGRRRHARQEPSRRGQRRTRDVAGGDVVPGEVRPEPGRKFVRVQLDVPVHARRESFIDVSRCLLEPRVVLHAERVLTLRTEVALHAVAAEPKPHLTARAQQAHGNAGTVVLELHVRERVVGRDEVLSPDVRNTVGGAPHLDLTGQIGRPWGLGRSGGIRAYRNGAQQNEQRNR